MDHGLHGCVSARGSCRLAQRVHEDSLCEATSKLAVSDSVVGLRKEMHSGRRRRGSSKAISSTRAPTAQCATGRGGPSPPSAFRGRFSRYRAVRSALRTILHKVVMVNAPPLYSCNEPASRAGRRGSRRPWSPPDHRIHKKAIISLTATGGLHPGSQRIDRAQCWGYCARAVDDGHAAAPAAAPVRHRHRRTPLPSHDARVEHEHAQGAPRRERGCHNGGTFRSPAGAAGSPLALNHCTLAQKYPRKVGTPRPGRKNGQP